MQMARTQKNKATETHLGMLKVSTASLCTPHVHDAPIAGRVTLVKQLMLRPTCFFLGKHRSSLPIQTTCQCPWPQKYGMNNVACRQSLPN
jgi:hypothetical protein